MIKEIYEAVVEQLEGIDGGVIKHIDWWNQNVAFIEQDAPWERPAVFVEFLPIEWERLKDGYRGKGGIRLHIVTDYSEGLAEGLDVVERVIAAMNSWEGTATIHINSWSSSQPNHDHEEIVENIETWGLRIFRRAAQ